MSADDTAKVIADHIIELEKRAKNLELLNAELTQREENMWKRIADLTTDEHSFRTRWEAKTHECNVRAEERAAVYQALELRGLRLMPDNTIVEIKKAPTLSKMELALIHDVFFDVTSVSLSDDQLTSAIQNIPTYLEADAKAWGWSDTLVRDQLYLWIQTTLPKE